MECVQCECSGTKGRHAGGWQGIGGGGCCLGERSNGCKQGWQTTCHGILGQGTRTAGLEQSWLARCGQAWLLPERGCQLASKVWSKCRGAGVCVCRWLVRHSTNTTIVGQGASNPRATVWQIPRVSCMARIVRPVMGRQTKMTRG